MKVIVTSWYDGQNPYSIERISTTVDDVMNYLHTDMKCFGTEIEFGENYINLKDRNETFDGEGYLKRCLEKDRLGVCIGRIYSKRLGPEDSHYFMFQVRNLH